MNSGDTEECKPKKRNPVRKAKAKQKKDDEYSCEVCGEPYEANETIWIGCEQDGFDYWAHHYCLGIGAKSIRELKRGLKIIQFFCRKHKMCLQKLK